MKMGNTRTPWRYDAEANVAIQPVKLRRPAISRYAALAEIFPISKHGPAPFEALDDNGAIDRSGDLRIGVLGGSRITPETGPVWRS